MRREGNGLLQLFECRARCRRLCGGGVNHSAYDWAEAARSVVARGDTRRVLLYEILPTATEC